MAGWERALWWIANRRRLVTSGRVIAVLGMHRSGTSCLTGLLEQSGVFLGDVSKQNPANVKGNQENPRIMRLHDDVLRASGGSWDAPPRQIVWSWRLKRTRDGIIRSYEDVPLWGFKDPRTVLVLDGWLEVLSNLQLVGVFRHPRLVAESLQRRNRFPLQRGLALWLTYNDALLRWRGRYDFPLVSFDTEAFTDSVVRLTGALGLPPVDGASLDFFDPELRHTTAAEHDALPPDVDRVYRALQELALT
jgi:hypothetical protein